VVIGTRDGGANAPVLKHDHRSPGVVVVVQVPVGGVLVDLPALDQRPGHFVEHPRRLRKLTFEAVDGDGMRAGAGHCIALAVLGLGAALAPGNGLLRDDEHSGLFASATRLAARGPFRPPALAVRTLLALVRNGPFPELITNGERRIPRRAHESIPAPAGAVGALCSAARGREQRVSGHPDLGTRRLAATEFRPAPFRSTIRPRFAVVAGLAFAVALLVLFDTIA